MTGNDTRPTSIRLPSDLTRAIEDTARRCDRNPADQHRHLLKLGLARLHELEAAAQAGIARANQPNPGTAAASAHLAEHQRLCGLNTEETPSNGR